jgi:glycosyltransferase involved in cell wall biosynthesis
MASEGKKRKVSLYIPIFNEEEILERDLELISYVLRKLPYDYEIFVVDDASIDHSALIAEKIASTNRDVKHLRFEEGPTRRENLAQAFKQATGDIVAFMDIDLATNLRFVPDLIHEADHKADIVTGSRYAKGAKIKRRLGRLVVSVLYNGFIRLLFGTKVRDHECGFKAFKRNVILKLVDEMGYDASLNRGVFWDTELIVRALRDGYSVKEIPVWWTEKRKSSLYFGREIRALQYIAKFFWEINFKGGRISRLFSQTRSIIESKRKWVVAGAFALLFGLGTAISGDYGISWDETGSRYNAVMAASRIAGDTTQLAEHRDRYYGPAFELILYGLERAFGFGAEDRETWLLRHYVTFLLFFAGIVFFYKLCVYRFKNWKLGLLGCALLLVSPRVFAHAFYNSKDAAFLSVFIICVYTLMRYLDRMTVSRALVHGLACGFAIAVRLPGLILPCFTVLFLIIELVMKKAGRAELKQAGLSFASYALLVPTFVVASWPTLWSAPIQEFWSALQYMSHFPWDGTMLYMGDYVSASTVAWHYIPVWMSVSTPIVYLPLFVVGSAICVFQSVKWVVQRAARDSEYNSTVRFDLFLPIWFFLPLATVIGMGSVLYDGWRQMFFIYPALILLVLGAVVWTSQFFMRTKHKLFGGFAASILSAAVAVSLFGNVGWMIKHHPHQNVYFNSVMNRNMKQARLSFEFDYWGTSYKQGLEYIVGTDPRPSINVHVLYMPGKLNAMLLPPEDKKRITFVEDIKNADYFIGNYRWHPWDYTDKSPTHSIKIGNADILTVYRMGRAQQ